MKKIFFLTISALLLLSGCSKEMQSNSGLGDDTMTFTVATEGAEATKAVKDSDGAAASVNHWVMEVLDASGAVYSHKDEVGTTGVKTHTFQVKMVKGQTYTVLFWADTQNTYNTDSLTAVKLLSGESSGYVANKDSRDAFSAVVSNFQFSGASSQNVTLTRPFGQLNIVFTDLASLYADMTSLTEYLKFKPCSLKVTAKVPTSFNVKTQTAGTAATTALNLTASKDYLDNFNNHSSEETIFMDYFFATSGSKDVVDLGFSFVSNNVEIAHAFNAVPFQRNYRTNIKGNMMTGEASWTVTVDPTWESGDQGENDINVFYTEAATSQDVKAAIQAKTDDVLETGGDNLQVNIKEATNDDVIIPDNTPESVTPEIILNFKQLSSNEEIIIRDEKHLTSGTIESGAVEYEGNVTVIVPEGTTAEQVRILTDKSTVTVRGEYGTLIASCAPQTIVVEAGTVIGTLKVAKGNVDLLGTVTSIVNATADAEEDKDVVKVYMFETGVWTNIESEKGDKLVPVYPVITNGTKKYFSFTQALEGTTDGGTLNILGNISETPDHAPVMQTSEDVTFTSSTPVTVTLAPTTTQSTLDNDGMVYMTSAGERKTITVGENVTLRFPVDAVAKAAMYIGYSSATPVDMILNGHIEAYEPYVGAQSTLTVNPSGSLTSVSECLLVRWGATVDVDGTGASWSEETPQVKLGYGSQQGGVVTFKNTFVNAGSWWGMYNRNGKEDVETKLVLDNSTMTAGEFKGSAKSQGTSSVYSVVLKNNSVMNINGGFTTIADATVTIEAGSVIKAKAFDNKGQIVASVSEDNVKTLIAEYTGTGTKLLSYFGNVSSNVGYPVVEDNKLYIVGNVNGSWADFAAAEYSTPMVQDPTTGVKTYTINNAAEMAKFAQEGDAAYGENSSGKHTIVNLTADIDLGAHIWTPIEVSCVDFNGNNHTITNVVVIKETAGAGLFGVASISTVKDLTIDGAYVSGMHYVAAIAGHGLCGHFTNCTVKNAILNNKVKDNDDGDKSGAICGYLSGEGDAEVKNCTADNCSVTGYRDLGSLVGMANQTAVVTGNTATNCNVICDQSSDPENYGSDNAKYNANEIVGRTASGATIQDNTATGVTISYIK